MSTSPSHTPGMSHEPDTERTSLTTPRPDGPTASLSELFFLFFRIGVFTIGGGYVMLPLIEREVTLTKKWLDHDGILDVFAVAESIPGVIAVNTATLVGYKTAGIPGAVAAASGVILPSFIIILLIASFLLAVRDEPIVQRVFTGVRAGAAALIAVAAYRLGRKAVTDIVGIVLAAGAFVLIGLAGLHPGFLIVTGAVVGACYYPRRR
jgi:chromate transporter